MVPISGRLPDDLYAWLSTLQLEDATTLSDKLRIAVLHLKRMHEGDTDYLGALSMYRDLGRNTRDQIAQLERETGQHSEVLAALVEHIPAMIAMLHSSQISSENSAKELEAVLVKRTLQLTETLLRQAVTEGAAAYDEKVITNNSTRLLELARLISSTR
jgi:hypothetical protein